MGLREAYRRLVEVESGGGVMGSGSGVTGGGRVREASPAITTEDWFWGRVGTTGTEEDYFWRRLSDNWTQKDVLPATYLEIHNQVYEAYNANPMANAVVEMGVNFVLGDGLQVDARHKKVQALIDRFWNDADNRMNLRQYELATELSLYGELFVRFFVNPFDGHVKVGLIDPSLIDDIQCDPENIEKQLRCHRRPLGAQMTTTQVSGAPPDMTAMSGSPMRDPTVELHWLEGVWYEMPSEVMHFCVNKVSNAKRGKSDLATLLPWLRRYKDWLIDRVRINKYKAAFLWDVKLMGADRQTIERKMMEYARPPEPGSVLVHNESEEWAAVQPRIDAGNVAPDGQAIKMMVAMGAGVPEHYLAEGGDVNRATAAEMGLPTMKKYQRRQDYLGYLIRGILDRVIGEAQRAGALPRTIDTHYEVRFPKLESEEGKNIGFAAFYMARALQMAEDQGLVSKDTARRLFFEAAREEVDLNEEVDRLERELEERDSLGQRHAPAGGPPNAGQGEPPPGAAPSVNRDGNSRSSVRPLRPRQEPGDPAQSGRPRSRTYP